MIWLFFSASINSTEKGESYSAASVRETLKNLISSEPLNQPFSDEVIVSKLQKEGINLARRTVAKYRELMCIPSSREKKNNENSKHRHLINIKSNFNLSHSTNHFENFNVLS